MKSQIWYPETRKMQQVRAENVTFPIQNQKSTTDMRWNHKFNIFKIKKHHKNALKSQILYPDYPDNKKTL